MLALQTVLKGLGFLQEGPLGRDQCHGQVTVGTVAKGSLLLRKALNHHITAAPPSLDVLLQAFRWYLHLNLNVLYE